ncbi:hypothetical protein HaLaN_29374 [Haematococcus lacustris]|uniref:Uncharacterized protein n=1 Tax=Haematococcus lacustris TaxID=44745 RepID=A0A6A0ADU4_HAELA|nr:hypothetical protein HaLaN_29374 [Haematococcus lacustris]
MERQRQPSTDAQQTDFSCLDTHLKLLVLRCCEPPELGPSSRSVSQALFRLLVQHGLLDRSRLPSQLLPGSAEGRRLPYHVRFQALYTEITSSWSASSFMMAGHLTDVVYGMTEL